MTRFAFAAKWPCFDASGLTRTGCSVPAALPSFHNDASASVPSPRPHCWKKWRRVCNSRGFVGVMAMSLPGDELVEVEQYSRGRRPRRQLSHVDSLGQIGRHEVARLARLLGKRFTLLVHQPHENLQFFLRGLPRRTEPE